MKKENNQNTWKVHNRKSFIKWPHQGHLKKKKKTISPKSQESSKLKSYKPNLKKARPADNRYANPSMKSSPYMQILNLNVIIKS